MIYKPPFTLTQEIFNKASAIQFQLGELLGAKLSPIPIKIRKQNKIKTIQASLAIEGNSLLTEQVSSVLEGKPVIGPKKDIIEVKNAIQVYQDLKQYDPLSEESLLGAHKILMQDLIKDNGKWRRDSIGVFKDEDLAHLAPPADRVPFFMEDLFRFINAEPNLPYLLKACIFHYELEFIHPFSDGNGRMGRLWQQLLLMKENPVFEYISIEELIKQTQEGYYKVLEECDKAGESTLFIEYCLDQILIAVKEFNTEAVSPVKDATTRIKYAKEYLGDQWFSRKDYVLLHKDISTATASRDIAHCLKEGFILKKGYKNQVVYRFK